MPVPSIRFLACQKMSAIAGEILKGKLAAKQPRIRQRLTGRVPTAQRHLVPIVLDRGHKAAGLASWNSSKNLGSAAEDFLLSGSRSLMLTSPSPHHPPP